MNLLYALRDEEFASQVRPLPAVFLIKMYHFPSNEMRISFASRCCARAIHSYNIARILDEPENIAAPCVAVRARQQQFGEVSAPRSRRFPRADYFSGRDAAAKIRRLHRSGG